MGHQSFRQLVATMTVMGPYPPGRHTVPLANLSPVLVHLASPEPRFVAAMSSFVGTLSPRSYHCVPPHPATRRTMGPLRWPLCKNALGA